MVINSMVVEGATTKRGATFRIGKEAADIVEEVGIGAEVAQTMTLSAERMSQVPKVKVAIATMIPLGTIPRAA